jgi:hypothetical protein
VEKVIEIAPDVVLLRENFERMKMRSLISFPKTARPQ